MSTLTSIPLNRAPDAVDRLQVLLADYPGLTQDADSYCWSMLKNAKLHSADAGTVLFHEAMECKHLMLIVEGIVRVYKDSDDGREMTLYRVEPGHLCIHNLNNLVDGVSYPVRAQAETFVRGLAIPREDFHQALDESSSFRKYVLRTLTERLSHMANLISGLAFERLDLRVACWLIKQFEQSRGRPIELTHSDVAHELGTTREMISRILKELEHKRCIQLSRGRIHLLCKYTLNIAGAGKGRTK
ncbi:MAG: Crp/Fnr family transcriptional regulator [Gammaproteobacteria bacterium]|nr:Crp/Fnr family transcriptional regulator [Gammaproteobacteria bacterium]